MFCPNCGTQNDENNAKCQKCGFSIKGAVAPKFKGTMLMMNAPPGVAQRLPSPGAAGPVAKTAPIPAVPAGAPKKQLAKMTMIGVAPPSPGAVAPPAGKPESKTGTMVQPSVPPPKATVPSVRPGAIPRPNPAARPGAGASPPVNPFGGTMLMGAVPEVPAPTAPEPKMPSASTPPAEATPAAAPTASIPAPQDAAALSTTTPSVAPPAPANPEKLPSDMPTVASAIAPSLGPANPAPPVQNLAQPRVDWDAPVSAMADANPATRATSSSATDSMALAPIPRQQPAYLTWLLAVLTLGIYPLVSWLSQKRKAKARPGADST